MILEDQEQIDSAHAGVWMGPQTCALFSQNWIYIYIYIYFFFFFFFFWGGFVFGRMIMMSHSVIQVPY